MKENIKVRDKASWLNSGFQIFLFKVNVALQNDPIKDFDLAILINAKALAIKFVTQIIANQKTKIKNYEKCQCTFWKRYNRIFLKNFFCF